MAFQDNVMRLATEPVTFLVPDNTLTMLLVDYERGGVALNDPSEGYNSYNWKATYVGEDVVLSREPYTSSEVVFSYPGITELSFAFDQNMAVTLAGMIDGVGY
jgi:hypothetical protein